MCMDIKQQEVLANDLAKVVVDKCGEVTLTHEQTVSVILTLFYLSDSIMSYESFAAFAREIRLRQEASAKRVVNSAKVEVEAKLGYTLPPEKLPET